MKFLITSSVRILYRGLDAGARREVLAVLKGAGGTQRGRGSVLLTTHHLDLVRQAADRVLILVDGALAAQGTVAQIMQQ